MTLKELSRWLADRASNDLGGTYTIWRDGVGFDCTMEMVPGQRGSIRFDLLRDYANEPEALFEALRDAFLGLWDSGVCAVCDEPITARQAAIAESRGRTATYCSPRCRDTAAKRKQRAK